MAKGKSGRFQKGNSYRFKPGQSGNPSGRHKSVVGEWQRFLDEELPGDLKGRTRLRVAQEALFAGAIRAARRGVGAELFRVLFERAWGRPLQRVEAELSLPPEKALEKLSLNELKMIAAGFIPESVAHLFHAEEVEETDGRRPAKKVYKN